MGSGGILLTAKSSPSREGRWTSPELDAGACSLFRPIGVVRPRWETEPESVVGLKAERPSWRRGSREGRTEVGVLRLWRIGPELHPRQESCAPLSISLGTAEVGGAYRKPRSPVKSQSALLAVRTGQLAVSMGDSLGPQGAYVLTGGGRASAPCKREV